MFCWGKSQYTISPDKYVALWMYSTYKSTYVENKFPDLCLYFPNKKRKKDSREKGKADTENCLKHWRESEWKFFLLIFGNRNVFDGTEMKFSFENRWKMFARKAQIWLHKLLKEMFDSLFSFSEKWNIWLNETKFRRNAIKSFLG